MGGMHIVYWFLVEICNTVLFCFSFTLRYANIISSSCFYLPSGRAFGWLCLFPAIIIVYATIVYVNWFQDELLRNGCSRSLGLTLKSTVFDAKLSVIPW